MELPRARANSMRIEFGKGSPEPKDNEIFAFLKGTLKLSCEVLLCMYRDPSESCVFVKFKTEELLLAVLDKFPATVTFEYQDGVKLNVSLASAYGTFKYVRLFNLPPEIEDREIAAVMTKYGRIQRLVREKYAQETGFPIWSGVRGIHMEITAEIPATIHVRNFQARVFYSGMKNKCFVCGSAEHQKAECPKRRRQFDKPEGQSYKDVAVNSGTKKDKNQKEEPKMTGLGSLCPRNRAEQVEALKKAAEERAAAAAALTLAVSEDDTNIEMVEAAPCDAERQFPQEQVTKVDATRMDVTPIPLEQVANFDAKRSIEAPVSQEQVTKVDATKTEDQWTLVKRARAQQKAATSGEKRSGVKSIKALTNQLKFKKSTNLVVPKAKGGSLFKAQTKMTRARALEKQKLGESSQKEALPHTVVTDL